MKYPLAIVDEKENIFDTLKQKYSVTNQENIEDKIIDELKNWQKEIVKKLNLKNPFYDNQKVFKVAQKELSENRYDVASIEKDFKNYQALDGIKSVKINKKFWNKEIESLKNRTLKLDNSAKESSSDNQDKVSSDEKICRTLLQDKWKKSLDEEYLKWEFQEIERYRKELLSKLEEWLKLAQEMYDLLSELSLDTGLLFDLSKGDLSAQDISQLKQWVEYISKNDGVKELCDILGRLRKADKTSREELVKTVSHITQTVPDIDSNEEIVGIKIAKDLEHALPQELALLSDDETSILFDLKYIEGRLMCFDMEGVSEELIEKEDEKLIEVSDEEKLGPIIICVDTSGSMQGSPETIAKAVTLYMATRAIKQNRNCYLINFSTGIQTLDLSGGLGLQKVMEFLKMSFNGGTDVTPALNKALEMMKEKGYEKSDLLMISDFVMGSLPDTLIKNIEEAKDEKNKFYSLAIGNLFLESYLKDVFTDEWVYNPNNSSVHNIRQIADFL